MEIIDISVELSNDTPVWPGSKGIRINRLSVIDENSEVTSSEVALDVHMGTHVDAPLHFVANGKTTEQLDLKKMIGECLVLSFPENLSCITASDLQAKLEGQSVKRLLLKTSNTARALWNKREFCQDFCALTPDAAKYLADMQLDLIGIDYCSIQIFNDSNLTHQILLSNEIVILEGLDLSKVAEGNYQLFCLPLKVSGLEGISARAVLIKDHPDNNNK
jgi:arylformamidase